jgi:uncharacterized membrane protein
MKTILYVFAFVWFLIGLGALIGGQQFWMGILQGGAVTDPGTAALGWFWMWTFFMPALFAGALGAVLGRLDDIRDAIEFSHERDDSDEIHPEAKARVDPYIDERSLATHPDTKHTSAKRNHTLS